MNLINKILVPVDGSESSKRALKYAKELAEKLPGEITLLHVYELPVQFTDFEDRSETFSNLSEDIKIYGQKILDESEKQIATPQMNINKLLLEGHKGNTITEIAEQNNFDLIIMGSRGIGAIQTFLLGSVSYNVIHHAKIPVMLIQ